jgi:DNA-binding CsgD family transcriptional regulator
VTAGGRARAHAASAVVGRDEPLVQVRALIGTIASEPAALVLTGEAGIGKTTLWQAAVDEGVELGFRVLVSRPAEAESALAYSGLADLLTHIDRALLQALPEPQCRALEAALLLSDFEGHPPDPRAIFTAFGAVLRALAASAPVLVAVDDRQWLDRSSASALEFVWRRLSDEPIGIVATERVAIASPPTERQRFPGGETVRLGPLSPASLHHLIKLQIGVSLTRSAVLRVHRMTSGNPFFALELARVLVAADLPGATEPWPVPEDLREMVASRVAVLPRGGRSSLLRAAASGRPGITGLTVDARRAAEVEGIVAADASGAVRFAHPLYAAAIYRNASAAERRRVHASLAAGERDIEEQARHRALACDGVDSDVAELLERAAASARARGAPDIAADLQETAVALTPLDRGADRFARSLRAAEFRFVAGDLGRARHLLLELLERAASTSMSEALTLLGEVSYHLGSLDDALDFLRRAVEAGAGDPLSTARAELDLSFVLMHSFGSFEEAGASARRAVTAAEALGDDALLAIALAGSAHIDLILGQGLDGALLERALELEDPERSTAVEMRPTLNAASALIHVDELDRARLLLESLRRQLTDRGEESELPDVLAPLARLECLAGNLVQADAVAREGYELALQEGSHSLAASMRAMQALVAAHAGREGDTRTAARDATGLAAGSGWRLAAFWATVALGLLELSLGNAEAVVATLAPSLALVEARGLVEPSRSPYLPDAIEALVLLGELDRADRLTHELEDCARRLGRRSARLSGARCRALVLAARGETPMALATLEAELGEADQLLLPLELARSLIVKGQLERRQKQKRAARDSLERSLATCERIGASLWAERARSELTRLGRPHDPHGLTATENRVAVLAASGLTNREIAATAFMSEKTVEANLSRVYRKLGIRSRAELGMRLAARTAASA